MHQLIAEHPFFENFDSQYFPLLAGCASNVYFREGEYLFQDGGKATHFYLVRHGEVDLEMFIPDQGKMIRLQATREHLLDLNKILPPIRPWWNEDIP